MTKSLDPFRFLLIAVSGWMNQHRRELIDYLSGREPSSARTVGPKAIPFNDDQRRRLAAKAKEWEESFSDRWPRLSRPRPYWPGIAG
jgi:hypothetical protein